MFLYKAVYFNKAFLYKVISLERIWKTVALNIKEFLDKLAFDIESICKLAVFKQEIMHSEICVSWGSLYKQTASFNKDPPYKLAYFDKKYLHEVTSFGKGFLYWVA